MDSFKHWLTNANYWRYDIALGAVFTYIVSRCIYLSRFHPTSKFPGPRLASVSNLWLCYYRFTGRYPWAVERVLQKYGDVVRIAPNELVFITPQAESDIYASHIKGLETFRKIDAGIPLPDDGISFERDPARHRDLAKKLAGAWNAKALKSMDQTIHSYIDLFIQKLANEGRSEEGVNLHDWTDRLALDMSAEIAYGRKMGQLEKGQNAILLDTFWKLNFFITINRICERFPFLSPFKYFCVPIKVLLSHLRVEKLNREAVEHRVARRHEPHPLDHFDSLLPPGASAPVGREKVHMEILAGHLVVGGFESVSGQYHCAIVFLLHQPRLLQALSDEVRTTFGRFEDIDTESLVSLPFLNAVMNETLRMTVNVAAIIPRESPGALVDGKYIPKGVVVHFAHFAFTRSSRYFHEGRSFRPQRWLPKDHPLYEAIYEKDATAAFHPFGRGPRLCIAKAQGLRQLRLYLAKVFWALDMELAPGQDFDFERDSRLYAMWEKPGVRVRFYPARSWKT